MRIFLAALASVLLMGTAQAERTFSQGELDALLAPIALQPDGLVSQVLIASTFPDQVAAAAHWSRANPHLRGDDAVRAVQYEPWDPAVKALVAFPELLARMDDKPQWLRELGEAFMQQEAQVMDTVQALRRRAQATGHLATTDQYAVVSHGETIVVEPRTQYVYVRYYDPYVVYGAWWWPYYFPVYWRPWVVRPVVVTHGFFYTKPDWYRRNVNVVHRPVHVQQHAVAPGRWQPQKHIVSKPYVRTPEAQRRPIVQPHMPAASGFSPPRREGARPPQVHKEWGQPRSAPRGRIDGGRVQNQPQGRVDGGRAWSQPQGRGDGGRAWSQPQGRGSGGGAPRGHRG
jgi:hypothetical protein